MISVSDRGDCAARYNEKDNTRLNGDVRKGTQNQRQAVLAVADSTEQLQNAMHRLRNACDVVGKDRKRKETMHGEQQAGSGGDSKIPMQCQSASRTLRSSDPSVRTSVSTLLG